MRLGMISPQNDEGLEKAKSLGLSCVEFCVNVGTDPHELFHAAPHLAEKTKELGLAVASVGHWGILRVGEKGILPEALAADKLLIDAAALLGAPVFCAGCNRVEELSLFDNYRLAIDYYSALIDYASGKGIRVAAYNCDWANFIHSDPAWDVVVGHLPALSIKYDVSHCVGRGGDYLAEAAKWAGRFAHVHIKGSLRVHGRYVDDPPAGLDPTNWGAFLGILYAAKYDGALSIEPHSAVWTGELGDKGLKFTVGYMKNMVF